MSNATMLMQVVDDIAARLARIPPPPWEMVWISHPGYWAINGASGNRIVDILTHTYRNTSVMRSCITTGTWST